MPETTLQTEIALLTETHVAQGLTIADARDVLDWLEAHGIDQTEIEIDESDRVTIYLKCA